MTSQTNAGAVATAEPSLNNEMVLLRSLSTSSCFSKEDEEMTRTVISAFKAKESEIEKRKMEVRERVQAQLGLVEEETRRLVTIREEENFDVIYVVMGIKQQREYKEAVDAFNEKNLEKIQLITKLMEVAGESENLRLKKLEELSKSIL